jgi:hypothetical protein
VELARAQPPSAGYSNDTRTRRAHFSAAKSVSRNTLYTCVKRKRTGFFAVSSFIRKAKNSLAGGKKVSIEGFTREIQTPAAAALNLPKQFLSRARQRKMNNRKM